MIGMMEAGAKTSRVTRPTEPAPPLAILTSSKACIMTNNITRPSLPPVRTRTRPAPLVTPTPPQVLSPAPLPDVPRADPQPEAPRGSPQPASRKANKPHEAAARPAGDYEVGYGKPPRHSRYKPGQSGNPKGRPRGALSLNTIVRKRMHEIVSLKTARGISRVPRIEGLFMKAMEVGGRGEIRALERLFAMYVAAFPEPAEASEPVGPVDPGLVSDADKAILALMRAEMAAELRRGSRAAGGDDVGEEDDDA